MGAGLRFDFFSFAPKIFSPTNLKKLFMSVGPFCFVFLDPDLLLGLDLVARVPIAGALCQIFLSCNLYCCPTTTTTSIGVTKNQSMVSNVLSVSCILSSKNVFYFRYNNVCIYSTKKIFRFPQGHTGSPISTISSIVSAIARILCSISSSSESVREGIVLK
ncbi:hypothetical protein LEP1GSC168_0039 [Leptospira santarosai str. HAI134]|nr:hypothetical protein LEP1GSC168_0039 [Leptospira santarosai str. HAI134]